MTSDKSLFIDLKEVDGGKVTFGDNNKAKIVGIGSIGNKFTTLIQNVSYVVGLKHNLLSVSQLYDKGYKVNFESSLCHIIDSSCHAPVSTTRQHISGKAINIKQSSSCKISNK
ncbi:hypothetical protein CFOL_v3_26080 [Cephalotus follicularis]|uniref:Retrovirus-related Pol polyprotein from transposon TNT 1-94-like beta-barrel domain-containing protein n=1 Tax=Cephalotus follicularis TaxID=3775 RepID=A0A1Q3CQU1_CEPFO|nr:hypothetical protein CFOL_v3_26080 [Cephalotus follicularis]